MRTFIPLIIDTILSLFLSFILFLLFTNYFFPRPYSIITALILAGLFTLFAFKVLSKNRVKKITKSHDRKEFENTITQLNFMTKAELCDFFEKVLIKKGYSPIKRRNMIYIKDKKALLFFKFGFESVIKSDVLKAFNAKNKNDTSFILSETFSPEVKAFGARFDKVVLVSAEEIYKYLKDNDSIPEFKYSFNTTKFDRVKAFKSLLDRKKTKTYVLFGVIFLFMSYFVPYKLYYVIVGALFLIFSLICLLFGSNFNNEKNN